MVEKLLLLLFILFMLDGSVIDLPEKLPALP